MEILQLLQIDLLYGPVIPHWLIAKGTGSLQEIPVWPCLFATQFIAGQPWINLDALQRVAEESKQGLYTVEYYSSIKMVFCRLPQHR